jgi:hypothetical protein
VRATAKRRSYPVRPCLFVLYSWHCVLTWSSIHRKYIGNMPLHCAFQAILPFYRRLVAEDRRRDQLSCIANFKPPPPLSDWEYAFTTPPQTLEFHWPCHPPSLSLSLSLPPSRRQVEEERRREAARAAREARREQERRLAEEKVAERRR